MAKNTSGLKPFTSENQPEKNGAPKGKRISTMLLERLDSADKFITYKEAEVVDDNGKPTGEKANFRVKIATWDVIITAALSKAAKGDAKLIEMIWDRIEGKPTQTIDLFASDERKTVNDLFPEELKTVFNGKDYPEKPE